MLKGGRSRQEKNHSTMKSSSSYSSHPRRMVCKCGEEVLLLKSSTLTNLGKTFWRCPNWKSSHSCNFFHWCDEEDLQQPGNDEAQRRYEQEVADLEFKVSKLRRELTEERAVRRSMTIVIMASWALTIELCIFSLIKCVGS
ncbi:Zinc finger, GRF-type [Sesbania bispinosa]|nr:Zinc finger, GRF-type [Sesbania bispinosa]